MNIAVQYSAALPSQGLLSMIVVLQYLLVGVLKGN